MDSIGRESRVLASETEYSARRMLMNFSVCDETAQTPSTYTVCLFLEQLWQEMDTMTLTLDEPNFCNHSDFFVCNDGENITEINVSGVGLEGEINSTLLSQLPESIETLNLSNNQLSGDVGFWAQIYRFKKIDLSNNSLTGDVDFSQIDYADEVNRANQGRTLLSGNNSDGTTCSCSCSTTSTPTVSPTSSSSIYISSISVLTELFLNNNKWDEQTMTWNDFSNYPNLEKLDLSNNQFIGTITFEYLENLVYLNIENNQFTDIYDFYNLDNLDDLTELYMSNNTIREDLDLSSLPSNLEILECFNNEFTGELEMNAIPKSLITFDCGDNSFEKLTWDPAEEVADGDEYGLKYLCMFCCCKFSIFCFGILFSTFVFIL